MARLDEGTQALETSLFTPPASEKIRSSLQDGCSSLKPSYTEHARNYERPTESSQLRGVAGASPSLQPATPVSRPPFSLYKIRPKESTSSKGRLKSSNRKFVPSSFHFPKRSAKRIKETNARSIARLWRDVMASKPPAYSRPTQSSRSKEIDRSNESSARDLSTLPSSRSPGTKSATARDVDFEDTQLRLRGIELHKMGDLELGAAAGAHAYFRSETPSNPDQSREFYRSIVQNSLAGRLERDINDSIFLPVSASFIQSVHTAYRSLGEAGLPEPEYKAYAFQNLFIGQYVLLVNDSKRQLCAVRSVEWSLKPREVGQHQWHAPPLLSQAQAPTKPFEFDIYPDCQFWLCDKILNADYRESINLVVHCKALGTFCPYFSIEFKATTDDTRIVVNQVAAAGSISLFNRYQLKFKAHPQTALDQLERVRHYGLTMEKENWIVWLFEPKTVDMKWAGCNVHNLDSGTCRTEQGVRRLLSWINEIHRWGLCEYALGCEDDVKHILSRDPSRIRVSAIGS